MNVDLNAKHILIHRPKMESEQQLDINVESEQQLNINMESEQMNIKTIFEVFGFYMNYIQKENYKQECIRILNGLNSLMKDISPQMDAEFTQYLQNIRNEQDEAEDDLLEYMSNIAKEMDENMKQQRLESEQLASEWDYYVKTGLKPSTNKKLKNIRKM